ncbi:MAG: heparinase, partial [Lachnospiraceae bacterium]|nr:heparinase [Lachnospiraceae bacterium]
MLYEIALQYDQKLRAYQPCKPAENRQAWEKLDEQWMKETLRTGEERLGFVWPYLTAMQYLDFARTGNRERFQAPYYEKRKALGDLALAECVEYRGRFLDDIVNGIFSICEESSWCMPAHNRSPEGGWLNLADSTSPIIDLFAAETGAILSMVLYLLETPLREFDPIIPGRIRYELDRRILTPFLEKHFWWMGEKGEKTNNWTVWCGQNVLITALLSEKDPGRRRMILEKVCKCADYFISDYGEDGCCDEGASYYRQSTLCLHQILEICNEVMNGAFESCFLSRKFQNMAMFLYHMHVEGNYYINFADCSAMPG